jgi:hypothetical protein
MTNSELINAYLDNELNEAERLQFEERLRLEPDLKEELSLHEDIIEGIRNTRKAELKHRLNQVDVGGHSGWSTAQVLGTIAIIAAGVTAVYFLYPENESQNNIETTRETVNNELRSDESIEKPAEVIQAEKEDIESTQTVDEPEEAEVYSDKNVAVEENQEVTTGEAERQPEDKRPVVAPSFDNGDAERSDVKAPDGAILGEMVTGDSRVDVEVIRNMPNRDFHYTFEDETLKLYGDFDNDLYEIFEFNSDKGQRWFLSYEDKYYSLDATATGIMPLTEIEDNKLLDVLKNIH